MSQRTAVTHFAIKTSQRCYVLFALSVILLATQPGCVTTRSMFAMRNRDPMAGARRLENANDPRLEEVVAHLNRNTNKIQSWRANNVRIHAGNFSLSGKLAVEKNNHLRLEVSSPLGKEVDLGSNDERFWVWSKRMEPAFITCKHENIDQARQAMGLPFEPDWLMEALGVSPLPTSNVTMEADPTNQQVRLVKNITSAHGQPLRRVILVDLKKGYGVVVEHSLYDYYGKRIAFAKLSAHSPDKETGVVLPHRVMIDWPEQQMQMTMDLGKIQVNPAAIPSQLWAMPELAGYDVVELDRDLPRTRVAAGVRLGPIETKWANDRNEEDAHQPTDDADTGAIHAGHSRISDEDGSEEAPAAPADDDWSE